MKALKLFLLTLFAALGLAAQAQTIEVYKDGQVIDSFPIYQVDSVVCKQITDKFYYYVGLEEPSSENFDEIKMDTAIEEWNYKKVVFPKGTPYFAFPREWKYVIYDENGFELAYTETEFSFNGQEYIKFSVGRKLANMTVYITVTSNK